MSSTDTRDAVDAEAVVADLPAAFQKLSRLVELELHVSAPCTVVGPGSKPGRYDVTYGFLPVFYSGQAEVPGEPIIIPDAVLRYPKGYTAPVLPGDTGHVIFTDRCLVKWMELGAPVDPFSGRAHDLADAIFEPGLVPDTQGAIPDPTGVVIDDAGLVSLGAAASSFGVLGTQLTTSVGVAAETTTIAGILNLVPNAAEPTAPTAATLANANKAAILAIAAALRAAISTKVRLQ